MSKLKRQMKENQMMRMLDDAFRKDRNMVKIGKGNTKAHERTKFDICWGLLQEDRNFVTEARFKSGGRADVFDITTGVVYEVICSETKKQCEEKVKKYPCELEIIIVEAIKDGT